jgi:hypothetical protein
MSPPGIEKDRPLDRFDRKKNAGADPGIVTKQSKRLVSVARLENDERAAAIRIGASQDDAALLIEAVHERRVLVPERLLSRRSARYPRRPRVTEHEEDFVRLHNDPR